MEEKYCCKCYTVIPADSEYHYCKECEKKIMEREFKRFIWWDMILGLPLILLHPFAFIKTYKTVRQKQKASK